MKRQMLLERSSEDSSVGHRGPYESVRRTPVHDGNGGGGPNRAFPDGTPA
jgi:hypothetical protein